MRDLKRFTHTFEIQDLGLDSLDHVEVVMALEDEFGSVTLLFLSIYDQIGLIIGFYYKNYLAKILVS